jgi:hypothetical protein
MKKAPSEGITPSSPARFDKGRPWMIWNFDSVGIGLMVEKGSVMKIQNVEADLPTEKVGNIN